MKSVMIVAFALVAAVAICCVLGAVLAAALGSVWCYTTVCNDGYSAYIPILDDIVVGVFFWGPVGGILGAIIGAISVAIWFGYKRNADKKNVANSVS